MYDDILEEQALLWEMTKEAADYEKGKFTGDASEFGKLTNREKMQISRRRFDKVDGKSQSLKDMDIRKRDYLRALVGRGTGYYDIQSSRRLGKHLSDVRKGLTGDELKLFNKRYSKGGKKAFEALSKSQQRNLMAEAMKMKDMPASGFGRLSNPRELIDPQLARLEAFKRAKRGLMMRGAGKAGLTAAGLGALGYGGYQMSKKSSYDPVVELVEDLDGWEFAKEAELRAAEILLENGIDPETFEETYPEHVKLASFPEPGDAMTYEGDEELIEYNEMLDDAAYDILDELGF